jgi:hypothetical protein
MKSKPTTMSNYNRLSSSYNTKMLELLIHFQNNGQLKQSYGDKKYCLFYPSFGVLNNKPIDFLIYGQAVNGWANDFSFGDKLDLDFVAKAIEFSNTINEGELSPLDWVNINWTNSTKLKAKEQSRIAGYQVFRSFFWNVCYKLVSDYYKLDREKGCWCKHMVWSNLMKIAPKDSGNPNDEEYYAQLKPCMELFKKELDELKPRFAILLANYSWAEEFVKALKCKSIVQDADAKIQFIGQYNETQVIVTKRPFRGNSEDWVKELLGVIDKR